MSSVTSATTTASRGTPYTRLRHSPGAFLCFPPVRPGLFPPVPPGLFPQGCSPLFPPVSPGLFPPVPPGLSPQGCSSPV